MRSGGIVALALVAASWLGDEALRLNEPKTGAFTAADKPAKGSQALTKRFDLAAEHAGPLTITLESCDFDALLRVENEAGEKLAEDNDGGVETNARVVLKAAEGGRYRVVAESPKGERGEFRVLVVAGETKPLAGEAWLSAALAFRATAIERALARKDGKSAAKHRLREAFLFSYGGKPDDSKRSYDAAIALAKSAKDKPTESRGTSGLAWLARGRGDHARARELFERALALAREANDARLVADATANVGRSFFDLKDFPKAHERFETWLASSRERKDAVAEAQATSAVGLTRLRLGDADKAREFLESALALAAKTNDRGVQAQASGGLGEIALARKEFPASRKLFARQMTLAREVGDEDMEKSARDHLRVVDDALAAAAASQPMSDEDRRAEERRRRDLEGPASFPATRAATAADLPAARAAIEGGSTATKASITLDGSVLALTLELADEKLTIAHAYPDAVGLSLTLWKQCPWIAELRVKLLASDRRMLATETVTAERARPFLRRFDDSFERRRMAEWWGPMTGP